MNREIHIWAGFHVSVVFDIYYQNTTATVGVLTTRLICIPPVQTRQKVGKAGESLFVSLRVANFM